MKRLVFDIEANGLNELTINSRGDPLLEADTVWCLCIMDIDSEESWDFGPDQISEGVGLLRDADLLIGHNIIGYEIPILK